MRHLERPTTGLSACLRALCLATTVTFSVSTATAEPFRGQGMDAAQAPFESGQGVIRAGSEFQAQNSTLPQPAPAIDRPTSPPAGSGDTDNAPAGRTTTNDTNIPDGPSEIIRDVDKLPAPVQKLRQQMIEAAASGDVEKLRVLLGTGPNQTLMMNNDGEDPIDTLKTFSGDPDGQEILAIMIDILSAGAARFDAGKPDEVYVWPYFVAKNVDSLTPPERVDLLRIVTAGDLIGMQENGNYNFYRLGITPDGQWKFLTGGD